MKYILILITSSVLFLGCSDNNSNSVDKTNERVVEHGIFVEFINHISKKNYQKAFLLLQPILKDGWTDERFQQDWIEIQSKVESWRPEVTATYSGNSQQGSYEQVTYRLDSKFDAVSSVDLMAMQVSGSEYITRIHIRTPYRNLSPESVNTFSYEFIEHMFNERFQNVFELMSKNCQQQFSIQKIKQLKPILGKNKSELEIQYYRLCANTVWYDVVKLSVKGDIFTFIELILSTKNHKIATLNFRGVIK